MQLKALLSKIRLNPVKVFGPVDREVESMTSDSREAGRNALFVALEGERTDGHDFVDSVVRQGASVVLASRPVDGSKVTVLQVEETRRAMAEFAHYFYRQPSANLKVAGVTGTNGKTTVTFLLKHLLERSLVRTGLIGTVRYEVGERLLPAPRTTPESIEVHRLLSQMHDAGCEAAVMEVSSHAVVQQRIGCVAFDTAIFTNLTQDHLDYHKTMDVYFAAKAEFFTGLAGQTKKARAVVNLDDSYGLRLITLIGKETPVITYGLGARADFRASSVRSDMSGTTFHLDAEGKSYLVRMPLIGRFNVSNTLAAIAASSTMGVSVRDAVKAMADAPAAPGRVQPVPAKRHFQVFVDYAHTGDALLNVLKTLRELGPRRLIVVFGCGGDRDRAKRPLMGRVASDLADFSIVTSDNPRKEEPAAIIEEILKGFATKNYEVVEDRREAIFRAIELAQAKDIVLIAGKGHEAYQEFADRTVPFDDLHVAQLAIESKPVEF